MFVFSFALIVISVMLLGQMHISMGLAQWIKIQHTFLWHYIDTILWDVMTSRSYICKTIHPILLKFTGYTQGVVESININFQSILKNFKNFIILTF